MISWLAQAGAPGEATKLRLPDIMSPAVKPKERLTAITPAAPAMAIIPQRIMKWTCDGDPTRGSGRPTRSEPPTPSDRACPSRCARKSSSSTEDRTNLTA